MGSTISLLCEWEKGAVRGCTHAYESTHEHEHAHNSKDLDLCLNILMC